MKQLKFKVEKTQNTEPTDPNEGEDDKTNTEADQNTSNGECASTNVNVDAGNDTSKN